MLYGTLLLLLPFQPATVIDVEVISGPGVAPGTGISPKKTTGRHYQLSRVRIS